MRAYGYKCVWFGVKAARLATEVGIVLLYTKLIL